MRVAEMVGGTNSAGVPPHVFALPAGHIVRYDLPAAALRPYISGYAIYGCTDRAPRTDSFLPAPPMICILADAGPVSVSIRNHHFHDIPDVALYGPTTEAITTVTRGGIDVGIGLTPLGWAALMARSAQTYRNRVFALRDVIGSGLADTLRAAVDRCDRDAALGPALDEVLSHVLPRPVRERPIIEQVSALLMEDTILTAGDLAERCSITGSALRRLCNEVCGMGPKLLLRRARFLRTYARWKLSGSSQGSEVLGGSYHDVPHYLRDARTFLGTTPQRFDARSNLFLDASLRARAAVLGASAHALHVAA
jgi:hypothetical protein